MREMRT